MIRSFNPEPTATEPFAVSASVAAGFRLNEAAGSMVLTLSGMALATGSPRRFFSEEPAASAVPLTCEATK